MSRSGAIAKASARSSTCSWRAARWRAQGSGSRLDGACKEGDFVQKGQVLFHIDPRPLAAAVDQARAALARDEAQAEAGRRDDERYKKLADMGYVSRSQSDQAHATAV